MFHVGGHQGSRGRSTAFSKTYNNILKNADWRPPLRCGIQFCTLSCILFVVGIVLTCLGIHDVFGETVPITGPILLTVGALFLILASRQFFLAHTRKKLAAANKEKEGPDGKKSAASDADDGTGPSTILLDGIREKDGYSDGTDHQLDPNSKVSGMQGDANGLKGANSPEFEQGTYIWPTLPFQPSPFACVSLMLGKDPTTLYAGQQLRQGYTCGYSPGTTSTTLSPSRIDSSLSPTSPLTDQAHMHEQQLLLAAASDAGLQYSPPSGAVTPGTVAVVAETSDSHKASKFDLSSKRPDPQGLPAMIAKEGISSLPSRTAIMMLRTLELQETI